jgi:hypothetical protein
MLDSRAEQEFHFEINRQNQLWRAIMRTMFRFFAVLVLLPLLALTTPTGARAAIYTYSFDPGTVVDFNDGTGPTLSTITGTFTVDTTAALVTSSSVILSGPAEGAGNYNQGGTADSNFDGFIELFQGNWELALAFRAPFGATHLSLGAGAAVEARTDIVSGSQSGEQTSGGITLLAAVPEPSTWAMMILGFFGVSFMVYRRRNQATLPA